MPSSDYASAIGGGLKLKGAASGAGIDKKKKKKHKSKETTVSSKTEGSVHPAADATPKERSALQAALADEDQVDGGDDATHNGDLVRAGDTSSGTGIAVPYKTEAQRKYEERRRQRLDERLRREGVQTHKERVEQLNKYLSGLSEHHDMPRIGPG